MPCRGRAEQGRRLWWYGFRAPQRVGIILKEKYNRRMHLIPLTAFCSSLEERKCVRNCYQYVIVNDLVAALKRFRLIENYLGRISSAIHLYQNLGCAWLQIRVNFAPFCRDLHP